MSQTKKPSQGILLLSLGNNQYMTMCAQFAMSIKHYNPEIQICVLHDGGISRIPKEYCQFYDSHIEMEKDDYMKDGRLDPGFAKCNLIKYLPYDETAYFDIDALAISDMSHVFDVKQDFATIVTGTGGPTDEIPYSFWAHNKEIWGHFELKQGQKYSAIQSSYMFFRKGKVVDNLYKAIKKYYDFPKTELKNGWGHGLPDELNISGAAAKLEMDIAIDFEPIFFGWRNSPLSLTELAEKHCVTALYGNGGGNALVRLKYREWYDRLLMKYCRQAGVRVITKSNVLLRGKHVN